MTFTREDWGSYVVYIIIFNELFDNYGSFLIHQKNVQSLAMEIYKL